MANTLQVLEMDCIAPNPLNQRSMDQDEIKVIQDSILEVGLLHPLTVYKEAEGKYILVSGHKRFEALKNLGRSGKSKVQCTVVDKPSDASKEAELLARANVHRSNPAQIRREVEIVNGLWNTMDMSRRKALTEKYRKAFIEANQWDPKFQEDETKFIAQRFRPRADYINQITGLNVSNRTITTYLKDTLKKESEGYEEEPKKERKITEKMITKAIESLTGLIEGFKSTHDDSEIQTWMNDLQSALEDAAEAAEA